MCILPVLGMLLVITALIAALAGVSFLLLAKGLFASSVRSRRDHDLFQH